MTDPAGLLWNECATTFMGHSEMSWESLLQFSDDSDSSSSPEELSERLTPIPDDFSNLHDVGGAQDLLAHGSQHSEQEDFTASLTERLTRLARRREHGANDKARELVARAAVEPMVQKGEGCASKFNGAASHASDPHNELASDEKEAHFLGMCAPRAYKDSASFGSATTAASQWSCPAFDTSSCPSRGSHCEVGYEVPIEIEDPEIHASFATHASWRSVGSLDS